jgi:hypothetical protein
MCFKIIFVLSLTLLSLVSTQCGIPPEFAGFRGLTDKEKHEKFKKLPLDKQVDFHLVMMRFHPPDMGYAFDIAAEGEKTLPYLIERLEREKEDYRKADIMFIFEAIHASSVDLRERSEVLVALNNVVGQMSNPVQKKVCEASLQFIKEHQPKHK